MSPIALDTNGPTIRLVLASDRDKPEAEQPHFIYRYLTGREWRTVAGIDDAISEKRESLTGGESLTMLFDALRTGLVAVGNLPEIDNEPARIEEVLGVYELRELISGPEGLLVRSMLGPDAKNAFGSPSPSSSDESASPAEETTTEPPATSGK